MGLHMLSNHGHLHSSSPGETMSDLLGIPRPSLTMPVQAHLPGRKELCLLLHYFYSVIVTFHSTEIH